MFSNDESWVLMMSLGVNATQFSNYSPTKVELQKNEYLENEVQ